MIAVILASKKLNINPDNVATPIAASMGDLITITLLSWIASLLFEAIGEHQFTIIFDEKMQGLEKAIGIMEKSTFGYQIEQPTLL